MNPRHDHVYAADDLYCAIVSRRKIQYQMVDFSVPDMEPVPQRNGYVYTVSSYTMIWKNDRCNSVQQKRRQEHPLMNEGAGGVDVGIVRFLVIFYLGTCK